MTAATTDRDVQWREAVNFDYPLKAGVVMYVGALVAIDSATELAGPCTGVATERVVGVAQRRVSTIGVAAGARSVPVRRGLFRVKNDAASAYTLGDIGGAVKALDDTTVSKAATALAAAGVLRDIDPGGDAWVEF